LTSKDPHGVESLSTGDIVKDQEAELKKLKELAQSKWKSYEDTLSLHT
jgi:hypothetical protein